MQTNKETRSAYDANEALAQGVKTGHNQFNAIAKGKGYQVKRRGFLARLMGN